jgi:deazaflavin-dependent oxidoreductase (nitroreductase family)
VIALSDIERKERLEHKRLQNKRFNNKVIMSMGRAGHRLSVFGLLKHTGRKSGKQYCTPVRLVKEGKSFIIPLTYGENSSWYKNLLSLNMIELGWQGKTYHVGNPELLELSQGNKKFPWISRVLFKRDGLEKFVKVTEIDEKTEISNEDAKMIGNNATQTRFTWAVLFEILRGPLK